MSTKYISEKDENLIITFDYNPVIISLIKCFVGRKFNPADKSWSVPKIHMQDVLKTLIPLGFEMDESIREYYNKNYAVKDILKEKVERMKEGRFKQCELDLFEKTGLPLREFQKKGVGFMCVTKSALLADDVGLGKSLQTLATVLINNSQKTLIVCPSSVKLSWQDEINKWLKNQNINVISGNKKERTELWKKESVYYIANYECVLRDFDNIKKIKFNYIICDEAIKIANPRTQISKTIKKLQAEHKYCLTGTPLTNSIHDCWSLMDFCQPGLLGTFWQFCERYCEKDRWGNIVAYKNIQELKEILSKYMLRRTKEEVLSELPEKSYETRYVEFSGKEKEIYKAVKEELVNELKEIDIKTNYLSNALVKLVRLKQLTCSLNLLTEHKISSKLDTLKELLTDIMIDDKKCLIFTQFATMAKILKEELKEYSPLLITGETDIAERNENIHKFQENDVNKILILTSATNEGVNLQRASYIIHYDNPWSLGKMIQREGRAYRIGQKNNVIIFQLIVKDTVDEYVLKILNKKQKMADSILGDSERINKVKISKADINKLLK
jgi:SNF2 family DNA or RNA helicase